MPFITLEERISIYYEELGKGDRYVICSQVSHGNQPFGRFASAQIGMKESRQATAFLIK